MFAVKNFLKKVFEINSIKEFSKENCWFKEFSKGNWSSEEFLKKIVHLKNFLKKNVHLKNFLKKIVPTTIKIDRTYILY